MATKLRASCDACHFAKIKCKKSDQGCQRCDSLGEQCFYSPALPRTYNKRRRQKSTSNTSHSFAQSARKQPISEGSSSSTTYSTRPSLSEAADNTGTLGEASTVAASTSVDPQTHHETAYESIESYWASVPEESASEIYASEFGVLAPETWGFTGIPPHLPGIDTPNSLATIISPRLSLPPLQNSPVSQPSSSNGLFVHHPQVSTSWGLPNPCTIEHCNCFFGILIATQRISEHASLSKPALDSVLCANRAAAKYCITSLNCASSNNISCATIACGLLDRILTLYHGALGCFSACLEQEGVDTQNPDEDENEDRAAMTDGLKVRLGTFAIEDSEQVLCARGIVTREIEKLRESIEGCPNEGGTIRSILLEHVVRRCTCVIDSITS